MSVKRTIALIVALCFSVGCFCSCKDKNKEVDSKSTADVTGVETEVAEKVTEPKATTKSPYATDLDGHLYFNGELMTIIFDDEIIPVDYYDSEYASNPRYVLNVDVFSELYKNLETDCESEGTAYPIFYDTVCWFLESLIWQDYSYSYVSEEYSKFIEDFANLDSQSLLWYIQQGMSYAEITYNSEFDKYIEGFMPRFREDILNTYKNKPVFPLYISYSEKYSSMKELYPDLTKEIPTRAPYTEPVIVTVPVPKSELITEPVDVPVSEVPAE